MIFPWWIFKILGKLRNLFPPSLMRCGNECGEIIILARGLI